MPEEHVAAQSSIDETSLVQALRDFEVANARVIDLTGRLVAASQEIIALKVDLMTAQAQAAAVRADLASLQAANVAMDAIRAGKVYRVARMIGDAKNATIGRR